RGGLGRWKRGRLRRGRSFPRLSGVGHRRWAGGRSDRRPAVVGALAASLCVVVAVALAGRAAAMTRRAARLRIGGEDEEEEQGGEDRGERGPTHFSRFDRLRGS